MLMAARMAMSRASAAAGASGSVFNPADKAANAVLTAGNTTLNGNSGANPAGARGTLSHAASTGLWYFTVTFTTFASPTGNAGAGIGTSGASLTGGPGVGSSCSVSPYGTGWTIYNTFGGPDGDIGPSPANGDIANIAWNSGTGQVYFGINGTYYDSSGAATGSSPTTPSVTLVTSTSFPLAWAYQGTSSDLIINTTPLSTPSGFTNWG